jgi:hypothetical protein
VIENQRQYEVTLQRMKQFAVAIEAFLASDPDPNVHSRMRQAQLDALRSIHSDLKRDIELYEIKMWGATG